MQDKWIECGRNAKFISKLQNLAECFILAYKAYKDDRRVRPLQGKLKRRKTRLCCKLILRVAGNQI